MEAAGKAGLKAAATMTGGGSDANIFNDMGIPCVIIGAGARKVHTSRESVHVDDMVKCTELIIKALSLAGASSRKS